MKKQIQEIINDHLPTQVAGEMKKYIESIEGLRGDLEQSETELEKAQIVIADYRKKSAQWAGIEEQQRINEQAEEDLIATEKALDGRQRGFELELAVARMDAMEANMKNMERLVEKVFGHPGVTVTRDVPVDMGSTNSDGSYTSGAILQQAKETTTESKT